MKYFLNSITYSKTFPIKTGAKTESQNVLIPEKKNVILVSNPVFVQQGNNEAKCGCMNV